MASELGVAVGATVRAELARRKHNQEWLAGYLGVSQANVSRRLRGAIPFDINELAIVAAALEMELVDLLPAREGVAA